MRSTPRILVTLMGFALVCLVPGCAVSAEVRQVHADWRAYVQDYIQDDGRVVDGARDGMTTSEGVAYALLRAVWSDDRRTFGQVLEWSRVNLQNGDGGTLPAWHWGVDSAETWGIRDAQPASDADVLMAYALLEASDRWSREDYRDQSIRLLGEIWTLETLDVGMGRVLLPGPWAMTEGPLRLNPSYFATFAFRRFAEVDSDRDWLALVRSSYRVWEATHEAYGTWPDWCWWDTEADALVPAPEGSEGLVVSGWEAMRIPWLLAADLAWYEAPEAERMLQVDHEHGVQPDEELRLPAVVGPRGAVVTPYESRARYGALLPAWAVTRPDDVAGLRRHISRLEPARVGRHGPRGHAGTDYYAANWVWFGEALWSGVARPVEAR